MVFTSLALLQLGHALAVRSEIDSLHTLGLGSNRPLLTAIAGTMVLQLLVIYWGPFQDLLHTEALTVSELSIVLAASTIVFFAVELEKAVRRRIDSRHHWSQD
jgi:Ca2+-transporting ATPase